MAMSAQILAPVARALEAAHKQGVVHQDVKPANILMANDRDPMLFGFGISKLIEGSSESSDVMVGTPVYMAPEQAIGMADQKSDIYALGVIFYQMVTGRLPYEADTPMEVILKKFKHPLPRPSLYVQDLPTNVENILLKALASDPQFRYQNMGEFASALEKLIAKRDKPHTSITIIEMKDSMNANTPIPPEGDNSNRNYSHSNKKFRISLAHPKSLSKRFESLFLCHIYLPEYRSRVTKNIKSELQDQEIREYIGQSTIRIGQKVRIKLFSPEINFSDSVVKIIDSPINKATFLGTPKDTCEPGSHIVLMSISDAEVDETIETLTITVRVADFAFDHVSRPLLSRISVIFLGLGSFAMFILTLLEQIDKTLGLTFGTAAGILATAVYANFYSMYQLIRPNTP